MESILQLARQVEAQEDLYYFARWMFLKRKGFTWNRGPHHRAICDALMRVYRGEVDRLIINVPPRYSKTELAVVCFTAWSLGHAPDSEFIHTSYSGALCSNNAWQTRELITHPAYREIFPATELMWDSKAKDEWRTTAGGCVYAEGAGGSITGYGAGKDRPGFGGAIIIDDPHKADEAKSATMRRNVIDWFQNTLESRKNASHTPIVLIMQRLHENDLSGWLLGGGNGEKWEHLCLPAITADGHALWPHKHTIEVLRQMETASPYVFAGQYGQRPSPREGGLFKPDRLVIVDAIPAGQIQWVRGWDFASVTSPSGDFTTGGKIGKLPDGRFIIADMVRERLGPDDRDQVLENTAKRDGILTTVSIPQDPGQAGKTQVIYLVRRLSGHIVKTSPETGDKGTRASPFAAQVNVGNVLMLRGVWNDALIEEMRTFPNGAHDDQIDALSRAFGEFVDNTTGFIEYLAGLAAQKAASKQAAEQT